MLTDVLDAGVLCVGTQVEVIIAMENFSNMRVKYKPTLKSVVADKTLNFSTVSVMLISDEPDITLLPRTESEIKVRKRNCTESVFKFR